MFKLINRCYTTVLLTGFFLVGSPPIKGQSSTKLNQYGLYIISSKKEYQITCRRPGYKMINIKKMIPDIILDLRYAGKSNFMHTKLYPTLSTTYIREKAALQLDSVQQTFKSMGLGLKIFDAYRPYSVTEKMWMLVQDDRYTADPKKGSGHNRGTAIDLTIIDLKTKKELEMGTEFDNFSDTAHHAFQQLPALILKNRIQLKTLMEQFGFKALDTEWWHYSLPDAREYELLDIPFKDLR